MKSILKKVSVFFVVLSMVVTPILSYAHEMWYTVIGGTVCKYPIQWAYKNSTNTKVSLACSNYLLSGPFASYYNSVLSSWNSCQYTVCSDTSYSLSKVDFITPTTSWWSSMGYPPNGLAATLNKNSSGIEFTDFATVRDTTDRTVTSSCIYVNPYITSLSPTDMYIESLSHELGHVQGLGHSDMSDYEPYSGNSIMKGSLSTYPGYYTPQTHEVNDIKSKYGF